MTLHPATDSLLPTVDPAPETLHVAVIGAGKAGTAVARSLLDAGYRVSVSASGDPARLELMIDFVTPGAEPKWTHDAVAEADLVILALPLHRLHTIDPALLAGRVVVDTMNYWPPVDGEIPAFRAGDRPSSEVVQDMFPGAAVVKTFSHTGYHHLEPDRRPAGHPERRGLAVAGNQPGAVALVSALVDRIGYDPVCVDSLAGTGFLQPGGPAFGARLTAAQLSELAGAAASAA
ncbi:NADPH-dependent F420 reductase [Arthrobacter caoxuetaonis]|uniref:NAD(P)-binding domain-containing protein n=1 Tax=Arthrobacter caoxuetaonis TaxID=2886935 RepID=A0A9X1SBV6_9MICC|nr:NAD(P)-binding domain-containing protein [Arthrobacter caoxuetaonis]MCC3298060.1 NAD(P)-binding domain-containing protein [Arthrobacter caoxuetaonis]USQ57073.1 NAD(P)-binding domain-containing protein [Arthrobacter caoxuetaonis]